MTALKGKLRLRRTCVEDSLMIWEARQSPTTYPTSQSKSDSDYEEHCSWMAKAVFDPAILFFTAIVGTTKAGYVRFNKTPPSKNLNVSIALHPSAQGLGYGRELLELGCHKAMALGAAKLHAVIHADNKPSQRIFRSCGFIRDESVIVHDRFEHYVLKYPFEGNQDQKEGENT